MEIGHKKGDLYMKSLNTSHIAFIALFLILTLSPAIGSAVEAFAQPNIILLTTDPMPPFIDPSLENEGLTASISKAAFQRVGYQLKLKFIPWKRALEGSKMGIYDGLIHCYYSKERSEFLEFSDPLIETAISLFQRKGTGVSYSQLTELKPYRIGVVRGAVHDEKFDSATFLTKSNVNSYDQNLLKLINNRIDLMAGSREAIFFLIRTRFPEFKGLVELVEPPLQIRRVRISISKKKPGYEAIITNFNRGLKIIQEDGTIETIRIQYGLNNFPTSKKDKTQ